MQLKDLVPDHFKDADTIGAPQLAELLGVYTRTLRLWSAAGRFPDAVRLGPKTHRYKIGDVRKALAKMILEGSGLEGR